MKKRNNVIIILSIVAIALFCVVQFVMLPQQRLKANQYNLAQQEVTTHDLQSILPYKNKYMGNASNNINLFNHLPLSDLKHSFSQNPKTFTFEVDFDGKSTDIQERQMKKEILYSATSAFALIDNLQTIRYTYTDKTYVVKRSSVEKLHGDLHNLLNESSWHTMQGELKNEKDVDQAFLILFSN